MTYICGLIDSLNRARIAAALTREGRWQDARKVMLAE